MPQNNPDKFNLKRFIDAQNSSYSTVLKELAQGKRHRTGYGLSFRRLMDWDTVQQQRNMQSNQ